MNFLAHLYLSPPTPDARLGSLLGDFVKGPVEAAGYNAEIAAGIRLHRRIDTFTDAHPVVAGSRARIEPPLRRYAGVLVDVFYDHFLAADWAEHHDASLAAFSRGVYAELERTAHPVPEHFAGMVRHLVRDDWFGAYATIDGIDLTLRRMSRRARPGNPLGDGAAALARAYDGLREDFRAFLPKVRAFAATASA